VPRREIAAIRNEVRGLLDDGVTMRSSIDRAELPVEMRLLLAEALEQETAVGMHVIEAIRAVELGRPADAVEPLRASGLRSDSLSVLLSAAQRAALGTLLVGEEQLLAQLEQLKRWAILWLALGLLLFAWGGWLLRSRLLRPIQSLESAVRRIGDGDLGTEVAITHRDELGRLAALVNSMTVMLRARAADETARREGITERFGRLLDESSNEIGVFDATTLRALQLNRGARTNLGYSADEVAQVTLPGLLRTIDPGVLADQLDRLRSGKQQRLFLTTRQTRKDGSSYPVETSIQYSVDRDARLFITVTEDAGVRERVRELDRALRDFTYTEQQRRDRGGLPSTLHAIAAMAAEALQVPRVTIWRERGAQRSCVGSSESEAPRTPRDFPSDPRHFTLTVPASARGGTLLVVEAPAEERPWSAEEQTFARAVATLVARAVDADERQALEQALARAQRMDSIGQLAGGIAHDFNNILTAILGNLELARTGFDEDDPRHQAMQDAEQAARRAADLTRQLLTFARHQRVEARVVDLNALTREADRMLQRLVGPEIAIVTELDPALRPVRAAPGQLEQVLVNLVVNARDATPRGGRITIVTRNRTLTGAAVDGMPDLPPGEYTELSVSDTGSGIAPEVVEHVFEPFFTTKAPGAGTGLGLAVCYGIVRQAGGEVSVTSAVGEGSTFRVLLPATEAKPDVTAAPVPSPLASGHETVLVVEDERTIRDLVVRALSRRGYKVLQASDGQEAIELVAAMEEPLHILVSDVVMPRLGGPEVARALRERWPALPVLLMSGYTADALRKGRDVPDSAFLPKPFTPDQLCLRVRELLDGAAGGPSPAADTVTDAAASA
jgi:PAS domain S-box-containing protein